MSPAVLDPVVEPFASLPEAASPAQQARVADRPASAPDAVPALFERVDPSTLQVVNCLFPRPTSGVAFLALLLRLAQVKQRALGEGFDQDMAVITVQSIRDLSLLIGWGYDTTHKYVVTFCALGLLTKHRANGKVELHFALGRYTPPLSLDALDRLIAGSRPKVQSYAKKVKHRYLLLYGNRAFAESPTPKPAESPVSDLDEAIQRIQRLIERESSPTNHQSLISILAKLERLRERLRKVRGFQDGTLPSLLAEERLVVGESPVSAASDALNGRRFSQMGDSSQVSTKAEGRLIANESPVSDGSDQEHGRPAGQMGDSVSLEKPGDRQCATERHLGVDTPNVENGRLLPQTGDSPQTDESATGRLVAKKSPITRGSDAQNGRRVPQTGDSAGVPHPENGRLGAQKPPASPVSAAENGRLLRKTGDSAHESPAPLGDSGSQSLPNVNVSLENLIKDQLNVNVQGVAAFLQTMFHEAPRKRGYYFNLHRQYPRPECWLAAAIETLLWVRRTNKDEKAGGYFYKCCVRLHQTETLPPESQALVAQYAHLSYAQMRAVLTTPLPRAAASSTRPPGQPDQYALFVARRKEELKAEWQASHPGERLPANPFSGGGEEQYAAFLARRVQEVKAACAAARAAKGA